MKSNLTPRRAASNWKALLGILLVLSWVVLVVWALIVFCFASWQTWQWLF